MRVAVPNRLLATLTETADEYCEETPLAAGEARVLDARHLRTLVSRQALGIWTAPVLPGTPLSESARWSGRHPVFERGSAEELLQ